MNLQKLHEAEAGFLLRYPGGFSDPAMEPIRKKHNVDRLVDFARENFSRANCLKPDFVADALVTTVSRSSMVSRFEKPPFREFVNSLDSRQKGDLARAIEQLLHGRKQKGFEAFCDMLEQHRLAKWSLVSVVPFYFAPRREAFVKPTTAKGIIAYLEVDGLTYQPRPTWAFYRGYRKLVTDIRKEISPTLAPNNAALTGFLMMSM